MPNSSSFFGQKHQFCEDAPKRFSDDSPSLPPPPQAEELSDSDTLRFARRVAHQSYGEKRTTFFHKSS